jgi:hypothetical protein
MKYVKSQRLNLENIEAHMSILNFFILTMMLVQSLNSI